MKYYKDFRDWNNLKKILNEVDINIPFYEKEIWWVYLGVNIGIEIDGKGDDYIRPAIIIKKFNKDHAWIIPLTTSSLVIPNIHVPVANKLINMDSVAIVSQLQTISNKRLVSRIGLLSQSYFNNILNAINYILPKIQKT